MRKVSLSFSLRDLCWLTLVAALTCTWLIERDRSQGLAASQQAVVQRQRGLARSNKMLLLQFAKLEMALAERGYRHSFNIIQRPGEEPEVQLVEDGP